MTTEYLIFGALCTLAVFSIGLLTSRWNKPQSYMITIPRDSNGHIIHPPPPPKELLLDDNKSEET